MKNALVKWSVGVAILLEGPCSSRGNKYLLMVMWNHRSVGAIKGLWIAIR